jgi:hypothetical protein
MATATAPETLELIVNPEEDLVEESTRSILRAVLIAVGVAAVVATVAAILARKAR